MWSVLAHKGPPKFSESLCPPSSPDAPQKDSWYGACTSLEGQARLGPERLRFPPPRRVAIYRIGSGQKSKQKWHDQVQLKLAPTSCPINTGVPSISKAKNGVEVMKVHNVINSIRGIIRDEAVDAVSPKEDCQFYTRERVPASPVLARALEGAGRNTCNAGKGGRKAWAARSKWYRSRSTCGCVPGSAPHYRRQPCTMTLAHGEASVPSVQGTLRTCHRIRASSCDNALVNHLQAVGPMRVTHGERSRRRRQSRRKASRKVPPGPPPLRCQRHGRRHTVRHLLRRVETETRTALR